MTRQVDRATLERRRGQISVEHLARNDVGLGQRLLGVGLVDDRLRSGGRCHHDLSDRRVRRQQTVEADLPHHAYCAAGNRVAAGLVPRKTRPVDQRHIADAAETKRVGGGGPGRPRPDHRNGEVSSQALANVLPMGITFSPQRKVGERCRERQRIRHPHAEGPIRAWLAIAAKADWANPAEIKRQFGTTVDFVGDNRVIFDLSSNKYRLVVHVSFTFGRVLVKFIGTRAAYDRIDPGQNHCQAAARLVTRRAGAFLGGGSSRSAGTRN